LKYLGPFTNEKHALRRKVIAPLKGFLLKLRSLPNILIVVCCRNGKPGTDDKDQVHMVSAHIHLRYITVFVSTNRFATFFHRSAQVTMNSESDIWNPYDVILTMPYGMGYVV
jgi:hypothetical protein